MGTKEDQQSFIGKTVLVSWDNKTVQGWYVGTVHSTGPFTVNDLKRAPSSNVVVKYSNKYPKVFFLVRSSMDKLHVS